MLYSGRRSLFLTLAMGIRVEVPQARPDIGIIIMVMWLIQALLCRVMGLQKQIIRLLAGQAVEQIIPPDRRYPLQAT